MDYRLTTILLGVVMAILGFAFAFSDANSLYITLKSPILACYPNLISGIIIGIGGIIIAIIGAEHFKEQKHASPQISICPSCGAKVKADANYCIKCGQKIR